MIVAIGYLLAISSLICGTFALIWSRHPETFQSQEEKEKPGLEVKFKVGEQLPWKGIWMQIDKVHKDRLELVPVGLTWQMNKKIKASKGE